jgi:hypothetical protein
MDDEQPGFGDGTMRKVKELTPEDFPGVDARKFRAWRQAHQDANRNTIILAVILIALNVVLFFATGRVMTGGIILLGLVGFFWLKPERLWKGLGISKADLRAARKRSRPPKTA